MNNSSTPTKPIIDTNAAAFNEELRYSLRECNAAVGRLGEALQGNPTPQQLETARQVVSSMAFAIEEMDKGLAPLAQPGAEYIRREIVEISGSIVDRKMLDACHDNTEFTVEAAHVRRIIERLEALAEKIGMQR